MPVAGFVLALPSLAVAADQNSDSLCKPEEVAVFNCLTGKEAASLCASPTEAALTLLAYRYGAGQKVENEFIATAANGKTFQRRRGHGSVRCGSTVPPTVT